MNRYLIILFFILAVYFARRAYIFKKQYKKYKKSSEANKKKLENQKNKIEDLEQDIKAKLKKARNVHQRMLPDNLAEPENFFISDYYQPAEYIGGDYYNFFKIDHGSLDPFFDQYLLYFFDVSGHGIDSTLLSIFVNESIENYFRLRHNPGEKISTRELMNYIDHRYQNEEFPDDYLVCLFIAVLDNDQNTLSYSSGGFQYPVFKMSSDKEPEEINIGGLPISTALGALADSRKEKKINLNENDSIFLSTDGLLEQSQGDRIYYHKLQKLLKKYKQLPAAFLKDLIKNDFYNFSNNKLAQDDVTFLIMEKAEGDILNYEFQSSEIKEAKTEISELIDKNLMENSKNVNKFKEIVFNILAEVKNKLSIKAVNNQYYLLLSLEKKNINFKEYINQYSDLISLAEADIQLNLESQKKFLSKDNIYISYNQNKERIFLMIMKKDF